MPAVLLPLLAEMGVSATFIAGLVLAARIAVFAHAFIRRGL